MFVCNFNNTTTVLAKDEFNNPTNSTTLVQGLFGTQMQVHCSNYYKLSIYTVKKISAVLNSFTDQSRRSQLKRDFKLNDQCPSCYKCFGHDTVAFVAHLKNHLQSLYSCSICGDMANSEENMHAHLNTKHGI